VSTCSRALRILWEDDPKSKYRAPGILWEEESRMSCAWWLGVQVPRAVPASGYVRAAAGSTPSSHRSPGTLERLFHGSQVGRLGHRMFCHEFPFRLRASTCMDSLRESSPAFPLSVDWGTMLVWARTGLSWHSWTSLARPWQKCLRRSHASTSEGSRW